MGDSVMPGLVIVCVLAIFVFPFLFALDAHCAATYRKRLVLARSMISSPRPLSTARIM